MTQHLTKPLLQLIIRSVAALRLTTNIARDAMNGQTFSNIPVLTAGRYVFAFSGKFSGAWANLHAQIGPARTPIGRFFLPRAYELHLPACALVCEILGGDADTRLSIAFAPAEIPAARAQPTSRSTYVSKPTGNRLGIHAPAVEHIRGQRGLDAKGFKITKPANAGTTDTPPVDSPPIEIVINPD